MNKRGTKEILGDWFMYLQKPQTLIFQSINTWKQFSFNYLKNTAYQINRQFYAHNSYKITNREAKK
jgi:hypothetical protein